MSHRRGPRRISSAQRLASLRACFWVQCSRLLARIAPIAVGDPTANTKAAHTISLSGPLPLFNLIFLPLDVAEPVQRKG